MRKEILKKPIGDFREMIFNLMTEESTDFLQDSSTEDIDEDFKEFENYLNLPDTHWNLGFQNDYIKIFIQKEFNKKEIMIKCVAVLPKIPKHIAFEALADIHVRKRWDEVLWNLTIIEEDMTKSSCMFYYNIRAPSFM